LDYDKANDGHSQAAQKRAPSGDAQRVSALEHSLCLMHAPKKPRQSHNIAQGSNKGKQQKTPADKTNNHGDAKTSALA